MQTEDYKTKVDLTPEQADYADEWHRARRIYLNKVARPYAGIGFMPRPGSRLRSVLDRKYISIFDLQCVVMAPPELLPEARQRDYRKVKFPLLIQEIYLDEDSRLYTGGCKEAIIKSLDFGVNPLQDFQATLRCDEAGTLRVFAPPRTAEGEEREFVIRRTARWIDLCWGQQREELYIQYRLPLDWLTRETAGGKPVLTLEKEGPKKVGDKLATIHARQHESYWKGCYRDDGFPAIHRAGKYSCSPNRGGVNLFALANKLMHDANSMVLLPLEERPATINSAESPKFYAVLDDEQAEKLIGEVAQTTSWKIQQQLRVALGARGYSGNETVTPYHIRAQHSGVLKGVQELQDQPHLKRVFIGDRSMLIPVTSVLLPEFAAGKSVKIGEPIADICERHEFSSWAEVESVLGVNRDYYLVPDWLRTQMIHPGYNGWDGPNGILIDYTLVEDRVDIDEVVVDFTPCRDKVHERGFLPLGVQLVHNGIAGKINGLTVCCVSEFEESSAEEDFAETETAEQQA